MRKLPTWSLLSVLAATAISASAGDITRFRFLQPPGPYDVGLRVIQQYDDSRSFGNGSRPLQTLIWYPAAGGGTSAPMQYGDYLNLRSDDPALGDAREQVGIAGWFDAGRDAARADRMWARRDAASASGRFPIVVYAPSFASTSWENADLCEYLASHGYLVVASPGMGVTRESTRDLAGVEAQARDISFLVGYASRLPAADSTQVAVVGFSWGGLANVVAAARDSRIDALVALDGSLRYWPGLISQTSDVRAENFTIPLLYFFGQGTIESQELLEKQSGSVRGPSVLNTWIHGDLVGVRMLGMSHPQFNSRTQRNERFFQYEFSQQQLVDYDRNDGIVGYGWVARYTRAFLDDRLKNSTEAREFLKAPPKDHGVPAHTLHVETRPAKPLPFSFADFCAEVVRRGFSQASDVLADVRKKHPELKIESREVASWGYERLSAGKSRDAVSLMRLAVELEPSGFAYLGLAESYERAGEKSRAADAYREAQKRDPENLVVKTVAGQRLEELERSSATTTPH
jgi:pimeloyl-ACP methyl ester carboxylesterase